MREDMMEYAMTGPNQTMFFFDATISTGYCVHPSVDILTMKNGNTIKNEEDKVFAMIFKIPKLSKN